MMKSHVFAMIAAAGLMQVGLASAAEVAVGPDSREQLDLTIYNNGLGFVAERRRVTLLAGDVTLVFPGLARTLIAPSVDIAADGLAVSERRFDAEVVSEQTLLRHALGETIDIEVTNPATGTVTSRRARVLSIEPELILEIDGKVHVGAPGRLVFDGLPKGVRLSPTLSAKGNTSGPGERSLGLSYLAGNIGWSADTVARIDPDGDSLSLSVWATLTNTSGADFHGARVGLVAGEVNRTSRPKQLQVAMMESRMASAADQADGSEALSAFHLYRLPGTVDLSHGATVQQKLFDSAKVGFEESYEFVGQSWMYQRAHTEPSFENADYGLRIDNRAANGFGRPLPAGTLRVYRADAMGATRFSGEDAIRHVPEGEVVEVDLGRAFDVTARRVQTAFNQLSNRITESAYAVEVKNAKAEPVAVQLVEVLPGDWEVLDESAPHDKLSADRIVWRLKVPAKGSVTLSYAVRNRF